MGVGRFCQTAIPNNYNKDMTAESDYPDDRYTIRFYTALDSRCWISLPSGPASFLCAALMSPQKKRNSTVRRLSAGNYGDLQRSYNMLATYSTCNVIHHNGRRCSTVIHRCKSTILH